MPKHIIIDVATGQRLVEERPPEPLRFLTADRHEIVADGADAVAVSFLDTFPDPAPVVFTVNGLESTPEPVVDGQAQIEVTASAAGPIVIEAGEYSITVEAV